MSTELPKISHATSPSFLTAAFEYLIDAGQRSVLFLDVMRLALARPFCKSSGLKRSGFLKLSDTAMTLFSDEFMLHLPGGPIIGTDNDGLSVRLPELDR